MLRRLPIKLKYVIKAGVGFNKSLRKTRNDFDTTLFCSHDGCCGSPKPQSFNTIKNMQIFIDEKFLKAVKYYIQEVRTKLSSTTLMKAVTKCNMLILGIYSNTLSRFKIVLNFKNIEYFLAEHSKFTGLFV